MIRFFDLFAGVGGFRAGLERAGGFECVGHCEVDRHADKAYRAVYKIKENEVFYEDATTIDTNTLPEFDLLCAGFPCQSFSVAGRRQGFLDPRGTLFFEIARVARKRKPSYLLLENVPGLLSHDKGRTFAAILRALCELGYGVEWQVLDSKDFGVPQSRRRVYLIGYLDGGCAGKVLPLKETNEKALIRLVDGQMGLRVYDPKGLSKTLLSKSGGPGGNTGLYFIDLSAKDPKVTLYSRCLTASYDRGVGNREAERSGILLLKEATKRGFEEAVPGDFINLGHAGTNTRQGRVGHGVAHTLDTCGSQGVMTHGRIRRLMPRECFRLQGFSEDQIDRILSVSSDTQAYKQAGNAVTVNVVHALGLRLKAAHAACTAAARAGKEEAA